MACHPTDQGVAVMVALSSPAASDRCQPVPALKTAGETSQRDAAQPWTRRCTKRSPSSNAGHCIQQFWIHLRRMSLATGPRNELAEPVVSYRIDQGTLQTAGGPSHGRTTPVSRTEDQRTGATHDRSGRSASSGMLLVEQPRLGDGKLVVAEPTGSVELVELSQSAHERIRLT
jgi:hypothetical protein